MSDIALPLFVYGTLRDNKVLDAVLGRSPEPGATLRASAQGWRAVYYGSALYPALLPSPGANAPGHLLLGLSPADFARLNAFEGEEYELAPISVESEGEVVRARAYLPRHDVGTRLRDWTFETWTALHRPHIIAHYLTAGWSGETSEDRHD